MKIVTVLAAVVTAASTVPKKHPFHCAKTSSDPELDTKTSSDLIIEPKTSSDPVHYANTPSDLTVESLIESYKERLATETYTDELLKEQVLLVAKAMKEFPFESETTVLPTDPDEIDELIRENKLDGLLEGIKALNLVFRRYVDFPIAALRKMKNLQHIVMSFVLVDAYDIWVLSNLVEKVQFVASDLDAMHIQILVNGGKVKKLAMFGGDLLVDPEVIHIFDDAAIERLSEVTFYNVRFIKHEGEGNNIYGVEYDVCFESILLQLARCKNLKRLEITCNNLEGVLQKHKILMHEAWPKLRSLSITSTSTDYKRFINDIAFFPTLNELYIQNDNLSTGCSADLEVPKESPLQSSLVALRLANCNLPPQIVAFALSLPKLITCDLSKCFDLWSIIKKLGLSLANLSTCAEVVVMDQTDITWDGLVELLSFPRIRRVSTEFCPNLAKSSEGFKFPWKFNTTVKVLKLGGISFHPETLKHILVVFKPRQTRLMIITPSDVPGNLRKRVIVSGEKLVQRNWIVFDKLVRWRTRNSERLTPCEKMPLLWSEFPSKEDDPTTLAAMLLAGAVAKTRAEVGLLADKVLRTKTKADELVQSQADAAGGSSDDEQRVPEITQVEDVSKASNELGERRKSIRLKKKEKALAWGIKRASEKRLSEGALPSSPKDADRD